MLSLLPLLISAAWADIPPTPPAGKQFTTYSIQVDGLEGFPDAVLVAYDKDTAELRGYEAFKAGDSKHMLVNGNNSRGQRFSKPDLYFMSAPEKAYSVEPNGLPPRQISCSPGMLKAESIPAKLKKLSPTYSWPTGIESVCSSHI